MHVVSIPSPLIISSLPYTGHKWIHISIKTNALCGTVDLEKALIQKDTDTGDQNQQIWSSIATELLQQPSLKKTKCHLASDDFSEDN